MTVLDVLAPIGYTWSVDPVGARSGSGELSDADLHGVAPFGEVVMRYDDPLVTSPLDLLDVRLVYITELARRNIEETLDVGKIDDVLRAAVELPPEHGRLVSLRRIPVRFHAEYKVKHGIDLLTRYFTLAERRVLLPVRVNMQDDLTPWVVPTARSLDDGDRAYLRGLERLASGVRR